MLANMDAVLCFVSLRVDLPAIGKVRDAGDFVGLTNEYFHVYINAL